MRVYLELDGEKVISVNTSPFSPDNIEIELESNHPVWMEGVSGYKYINDTLFKDEESHLAQLLISAKRAKENELSDACNHAILDGFNFPIDGEKYKFSFDIEAQFNFQGAERLLSQGVVDGITWTVKQNDEYKRITINKNTMNQLALFIFQHKANNISKYRDVLLPMVERATTVDEVESITWDSVKLSFEQ